MHKNSFFLILYSFGVIFLLHNETSYAEELKEQKMQSEYNKTAHKWCPFGSCDTCACKDHSGREIAIKTNTGWCRLAGHCDKFCSGVPGAKHSGVCRK